MNPILTPKEFRRAAHLALGFSFPGLLLACWLLLGPSEALKVVASCPVQIAVGYVAMALIIERPGISFRYELCGYGAGAVFGIFLFLAGVFFGSASSMILYWEFETRSMVGWVLGSLYWMGMFGILPAAFFGLIGTGILRRIRQTSPPKKFYFQRP